MIRYVARPESGGSHGNRALEVSQSFERMSGLIEVSFGIRNERMNQHLSVLVQSRIPDPCGSSGNSKVSYIAATMTDEGDG